MNEVSDGMQRSPGGSEWTFQAASSYYFGSSFFYKHTRTKFNWKNSMSKTYCVHLKWAMSIEIDSCGKSSQGSWKWPYICERSVWHFIMYWDNFLQKQFVQAHFLLIFDPCLRKSPHVNFGPSVHCGVLMLCPTDGSLEQRNKCKFLIKIKCE